MKRFIVITALAAMVAALCAGTAFGWGAAHPDSSSDYMNRTPKSFRGHELLLHDALLMLKARRLVPASLGETYLQSIYYGPFYVSNTTTSLGYKYLIKGTRLADNDFSFWFWPDWNPPYISSYEHYYMPSIPWLTAPIMELPGGGWNAKNAFMCYINGGVTIVGKVPEELGAIQRFKNGDIMGGFQCLGYAIHYLQDGSMPFHMEWPGAYLPPPVGVDIWNHHGVIDDRGDYVIFNERLQFEKDALERWLPNNDLSFANDALEKVDVSGKLSIGPGTTQGYFYKSQNLDDFYHAQASEANSKIQEVVSYYNQNVSPNWTAVDNTIRLLLKRNEERIAQLIFYVFWKAGMYPASITTNRDFVHPNTAFVRTWVPASHRKAECYIDAIGPGGFGTILLNRHWINDNLTIKSGAGIGKRSTITLVGRDGRKISENTGPYGGEAVINTSCGGNTGWYTLYVTSPDITSGTGNVYVNIWNNVAKDVANQDIKGKEPPQVKVMQTKGGGKTGAPQAGAAKGESPFVEIGYDLGRLWDAAGNAYRYKINDYHYDTDLFWTDMSYNYGSTWHGGYNNAVGAYIDVRFSNFYYDHSVRIKLYRPDGVLYGQSSLDWVYGMNTSGFSWNWWDVAYWWYLKWDGYDYWMQNYQGIWRYEVYIDNNLYTTQYFGVNAPPTITNVANGAYINGGPVEIGTSVKGVPNYVDIRLDGTSESNRVSLDYAAPYSGVVNASILADGAHTAYAYVRSGTPHTNGNRWSSALSFTVDKTKPTVSITAPVNGSKYNAGAVITVSSNATDTYGLRKVVFYANGKQIASDNSSPYSCTYTMPNPSIMSEFYAVAYDLAGNTAVSAKIAVNIHDHPLQNEGIIASPYGPVAWQYEMGYQFKPNVSGRITELGFWGTGDGDTKTCNLWTDGGTKLASVNVVDGKAGFSYAAITPVSVTAGTYYRASVSVAGANGYYMPYTTPRTIKDIYIASCCYSNYGASGSFPVYTYTAYMYGIADIGFEPDARAWPFKYDADQYPESAIPAWTYSNPWGSTTRSLSGGILTQSAPYNSCWHYTRNWGASNATGVTILTRFNFVSANEYFVILFGTDATYAQPCFTNTGGYKTYRITLKNGQVNIYADENPTPISTYGAQPFAANYVRFGTSGEGFFSGSGGTVYMDYFYYCTDGAYAPGTKIDEEPTVEGTRELEAIPVVTQLLTTSPNPSLGSTTIRYQVARPGAVKLAIYNISGQLVKTLANELKPAGYYSVRWDGKNEHGNKVAAGVYLYRMESKDYSATKKVTVLR